MRKKLISVLLLSFVWVFALCACGSRQAEVGQTPAVPVETTAPTPEPTESPIPVSTPAPALEPTTEPTPEPTPKPVVEPTAEEPTIAPSTEPVVAPKPAPSEIPEPKGSTEPVTSSVDQIPEFDLATQEPSGVIGDGVTGIDPNDPYYGMPGYEGPREGYAYSFMMGYYKVDEARQQTEQAFQDAANRGVDYWDWEGHAKAANEGFDYRYGEWVKNNMDWVNQYISKNEGCTLEEYLRQNCKYDE